MLYRVLLDNLSTAVLRLDRDLRLEYMNPAAEMLLQVSGRRFLGAHISALFKDTPEAMEVLETSVRTGHPFTQREAHLTLHHGQTLVADYSVTPLADDGQALILELQTRDRLLRITREEEMYAKQETTRVLIRGLAHEIKNPLGGLRGAAQLLERALPDDSLKEYTQIIIEEADRLRNLVDRMLGPRVLPQIRKVNMHQIIERCCGLINAETQGGLTLVRDYDPSIPELDGDEEQLIQAVLNIMRNAMQALTESGTDDPRITLRTRTVRQFTLGAERHRLVCSLSIIDNGPGIPDSMLENIFYPMISGRASGTGLGLSIAQAIMHQHQGLIKCESQPGLTEFTLFIPLEQDHGQRH
ncbi:nitrogen regulation protein NR(II) [Balneatrix alpica]|uniref:Sensory histidine kinase/phosphatase NtrB n=1 Tax=Balneatrix alpica TaxID=75684 RepID=A0ABV5ZDM9_9GAMM|nr:nitrogen regulation protein NR(II) [Balneatrix alpica]